MYKIIIVALALVASQANAGLLSAPLALAQVAPAQYPTAAIAAPAYVAQPSYAVPAAISSQSGIIRGITNTRLIAPVAIAQPAYLAAQTYQAAPAYANILTSNFANQGLNQASNNGYGNNPHGSSQYGK